MANIECGACGGRGTRQVQKAKKEGDKVVTVTVTEDCGSCRGSGVIPS